MKNLPYLLLLCFVACQSGPGTGVRPQTRPVTTSPATTAGATSATTAGTSPSTVAGAPSAQPKDSFLLHFFGGDSCITVSYALESDTFYNHFLAQYICWNRFGTDSVIPPNQLAQLVKRKSFVQMLMLFHDNDDYSRIYYYNKEDRFRLGDIGESLLSSFGDCCPEQTYVIADELLKRNNFNGLEAFFWKSQTFEPEKFPSLKSYLAAVDTANFHKNAYLAAFFHNKRDIKSSNFFLAQAEKNKDWKKEFSILRSLIKKYKFIDLGEYIRLIYNEG